MAKTAKQQVNAVEQGSIDALPSGALRVRVYAGVDPVTKRRHDLIEVVAARPAGADKTARATRDRLVDEVAERRNPRTNATVDQLLDRYLDQFDGAPNTLTLYRGYVRNHISPFLGNLKVGQLDAGDAGRVLRRAPPLPEALHDVAGHRPPHERRPRLRRPLPQARLPPARRRRRSATSTSSSPAPTRRPSAGAGWR